MKVEAFSCSLWRSIPSGSLYLIPFTHSVGKKWTLEVLLIELRKQIVVISSSYCNTFCYRQNKMKNVIVHLIYCKKVVGVVFCKELQI
ncbi:hypothetical protein H5410_042282, partial [Solanum commersonii]